MSNALLPGDIGVYYPIPLHSFPHRCIQSRPWRILSSVTGFLFAIALFGLACELAILGLQGMGSLLHLSTCYCFLAP